MIWDYVWLGLLGAFGITEAVAFFGFNKQKATLSHRVWKWFAVKDDRARAAPLRRWSLRLIMGWLGIHFTSGGAEIEWIKGLF